MSAISRGFCSVLAAVSAYPVLLVGQALQLDVVQQ